MVALSPATKYATVIPHDQMRFSGATMVREMGADDLAISRKASTAKYEVLAALAIEMQLDAKKTAVDGRMARREASLFKAGRLASKSNRKPSEQQPAIRARSAARSG
ncbi:MAG: hypothetical protein SGPRY_000037 [Prymnesium sp.]